MMKKKEQKLTDDQRSILKQALWDLNLTPEEFFAIIEGSSTRTWPDRGFCVARLVESVNWFKIVTIFNPKVLYSVWDDARKYVRVREIREGMDFASRVLQ
jgi:hypothetical protein